MFYRCGLQPSWWPLQRALPRFVFLPLPPPDLPLPFFFFPAPVSACTSVWVFPAELCRTAAVAGLSRNCCKTVFKHFCHFVTAFAQTTTGVVSIRQMSDEQQCKDSVVSTVPWCVGQRHLFNFFSEKVKLLDAVSSCARELSNYIRILKTVYFVVIRNSYQQILTVQYYYCSAILTYSCFITNQKTIGT